MNIRISKSQLNESIQHALKAVTSKTTIPILSGIKLDAGSHGLILTGSDTDISIQSFLEPEKDGQSVVEVIRPGSIVLPARFFSEIVKKLPSDEVEIELKENHQTTIRSGSSEIQIMGMDPEEYPLLPELDENQMIRIYSDLLKIMIRQTSFAVSTNESTPILTGVLWSLTQNGLKFTGCDRHRLATREANIELDPRPQFHNIVISGRTLNELSKLLPDQNTLIEIVVEENQILAKIGHILFYSRILDGAYPDTSKLIPASFQTEIVVETKALADAIDRAYLLSREDKTNIVKMIMNEDKTLEISSSSTELGKLTETIPTDKLEGQLLKISFNSKYMLDALKAMDSERIHIGFTGAMQPIIIKPVDYSGLLQLILPYRTTG
ncbi:DNA polymerase III subunit beta [Paenibacillus sp. y28]|uniref:DNA polymerase III subunit beta n=1 Tax=Paenibacillus sp. y28 TaxID=3129110 RepID=UPI0030178ECC